MAEKKSTTKRTSTKAQPKEAIVTEEPTPVREPVVVAPQKRWSVGSLFWGLLLVSVGSLLLLSNLGIISVDWSEVWRLWPVFIIAAGFSALATTHWVWKVLSVLFVLAAIAALMLVGTGQYTYDNWSENVRTQQNSVAKEQDDVDRAEVELSAGASKLDIASDAMDDIVTAELRSKRLRLVKESELAGKTQRIKLSSDYDGAWWFNPPRNGWDVRLTERLPLSLRIDAGASSIDADLSQVQLESLTVKAGASDTVIILGDKTGMVKVDIDAGVSSLTLRVPRSSGVSLNYDGGLSSKDLDGLREITEDTYESEGYETASNKIDLKVDAGLASFTLERY